MPYATPQPHQIHFVITPDDGAHIYATKFLPVTNSQGSRLKFWRVNSCLEMIGAARIVSWNHEFTGQTEQLRAALGNTFKVLEQWEALKAIETTDTAERLKVFRKDQKVKDIRTGCICTVVFITAETGKLMVSSQENAKRTNSDGYQCPDLYEDNARFFEPLK